MFFQRQIYDIIQNKLLVLFECVGGDSRRRRGGAKRKTQLTFIGLDECFKIFYLDYNHPVLFIRVQLILLNN